MAYTVTNLITNAFYASGIASREFQTVSGTQLQDGLGFLNDVLTDKAIEIDMIPYYSKYEFNAIPGEEKYFVPSLDQIESVVFFINSVRYRMAPVNRDAFFGGFRAENIESLPFNWHHERTLGGSNIYMYFKPDSNYPVEVWGLFRLESVELNQDLEQTLDKYYISYLKYALAERICSEFNVTVPQGVQKQLLQYQKWIQSRSAPMDLTMKKISSFGSNNTLNYGQINFGRGWTIG